MKWFEYEKLNNIWFWFYCNIFLKKLKEILGNILKFFYIFNGVCY